MSDETEIQTDAAPAPAPVIPADPIPDAPEAIDAKTRLREFEDEAFADSKIEVVRIGDRLERGNGSAFAALPDHVKAKHAALERLVDAEQKLADANAAVAVAQSEYDAALTAVEGSDAHAAE
jgi:hypothetical protein